MAVYALVQKEWDMRKRSISQWFSTCDQGISPRPASSRHTADILNFRRETQWHLPDVLDCCCEDNYLTDKSAKYFFWPRDNMCHHFFLPLFPWITWILPKHSLYLGPACITTNHSSLTLRCILHEPPEWLHTTALPPTGNISPNTTNGTYTNLPSWGSRSKSLYYLNGDRKDLWRSVRVFAGLSHHSMDLSVSPKWRPLSVSHLPVTWGFLPFVF